MAEIDVDALLAPLSDAAPSGADLEYDAAFLALEEASRGKPEQQFGDTVIPAQEPDWRTMREQAIDLAGRTRDLRVAMQLLRASTRLNGFAGFASSIALLHGLLERLWDSVYPQLDASDGNDPTMRLNALAPLTDEGMGLRDLYDAQVGISRGVGPIRVRDIAIAHNALTAVGGEAAYSMAQVQGGLEAIQAERPEAIQAAVEVPALIDRLHRLIVDRTGRADAVDFDALRGIGRVLNKACAAASGAPADAAGAASGEGDAGTQDASAAAARPAAPRGEIQNRQDAVQMLDRVIRYLEQAEPGNPAPLLIERAKKLIGVSFLEIMANLAPNAMDTIETVTGRRTSE